MICTGMEHRVRYANKQETKSCRTIILRTITPMITTIHMIMIAGNMTACA